MTKVFLHGLESSSKGTKARWFREHFPGMMIPDFTGTFAERMQRMQILLAGDNGLVLIGSSFGGLMATVFVQENENRVVKVVLLAPALNFPEFSTRQGSKTNVPSTLYIGKRDDVCPPDIVIPRAQGIFNDLSVHVSDDDHSLHDTFMKIDWTSILGAGVRKGI